jgi:hypothetical protein
MGKTQVLPLDARNENAGYMYPEEVTPEEVMVDASDELRAEPDVKTHKT